MKTVYNMVTGQTETIHDIDARERVERGGWAYEPVEALPLEAGAVPDAPQLKVLADMTVAELRAFAKEHGITLGADVTTKNAILSTIQAADFKLNTPEGPEPKA